LDPRPLGPRISIFISILVLSGCDGLLDVSLPGQLTTDDVFQQGMVETVIEGAVASFECGFSTLSAQYGSGAESVWWRATGFYGQAAEFNAPRAGAGDDCGATNTTVGNWYMPYQAARH